MPKIKQIIISCESDEPSNAKISAFYSLLENFTKIKGDK